jgi:serine/threonine-protein kinase
LNGTRVELPSTPQAIPTPAARRSGLSAGPSDTWQLLDAVAEPLPDATPWTALALLSLAALACVGFFRARRRTRDEEPLPSAPEDALLAGKYELLRVIGKGAMADVWEAEDRSLARRVAVKKITSQKARPIEEARTLASLRHPNILSIYEVLDIPEGLYLVFEFVPGKTLQQLLVEEHRLELERAKSVLLPVCAALAAAHDRCIVHRDLKPANIMISDGGNIKVMDFGIAQRIGTSHSGEGTPAYMAPEAEEGQVSPACDVYSLGVCLYEALSGERPFGPVPLPQKLVRAYPRLSTRVPRLPKVADTLIDAALDPDPRTRMKDVRAFGRVLKSIVLEEGTAESRPRPSA